MNCSKNIVTIENSVEYYNITKDIRNFKHLSIKQLQFTKDLQCVEQYEIICLFNECMEELMSRLEIIIN